jgi:hypothetical protein
VGGVLDLDVNDKLDAYGDNAGSFSATIVAR